MTWGKEKRELKRKGVSAWKRGGRGKLEGIYTNLRVKNPWRA